MPTVEEVQEELRIERLAHAYTTKWWVTACKSMETPSDKWIEIWMEQVRELIRYFEKEKKDALL